MPLCELGVVEVAQHSTYGDIPYGMFGAFKFWRGLGGGGEEFMIFVPRCRGQSGGTENPDKRNLRGVGRVECSREMFNPLKSEGYPRSTTTNTNRHPFERRRARGSSI